MNIIIHEKNVEQRRLGTLLIQKLFIVYLLKLFYSQWISNDIDNNHK